ncbi:MAG: hypothetical protein HZA60_07530 [Deltaproteobacteria bacterium]|nr:hypothetical protein [Deltaproteobacteria bacterium]
MGYIVLGITYLVLGIIAAARRDTGAADGACMKNFFRVNGGNGTAGEEGVQR